MSVEQAQAFMEKVKNDEDLQKRLNEAEDSESRCKIANDLGYEFNPEEARQAADQLSENDLESIGGGRHIVWEVCCGSSFQ